MGRKETYVRDVFKRLRRIIFIKPNGRYMVSALTTTITEIIEQRKDYIKFKTQNSNYELWKLS